jgi:catechol 2,3-dioxygenase-like lactoylglutathione lyase family enzyme
MITQSNLIAFSATTDAEQSRHFYTHIIKLREIDDTPFALVYDCNGTVLRIQKVQRMSAPNYTVLGWEVDDIVSTARNLALAGVTFEMFEGLAQNDTGIWTTPDGTKVAWFRDPDGSLLPITEPCST